MAVERRAQTTWAAAAAPQATGAAPCLGPRAPCSRARSPCRPRGPYRSRRATWRSRRASSSTPAWQWLPSARPAPACAARPRRAAAGSWASAKSRFEDSTPTTTTADRVGRRVHVDEDRPDRYAADSLGGGAPLARRGGGAEAVQLGRVPVRAAGVDRASRDARALRPRHHRPRQQAGGVSGALANTACSQGAASRAR